MSLRECPVQSPAFDNPVAVREFWRQHIESSSYHDCDRESMWVFCRDTRKNLISFQLLAHGTKDTILVNIGETFRLAAIQNAASIVVAHNHPSGDPSPSEEDIRVTRRLLLAGDTLQIELADHVIIGSASHRKGFASLRELGYFLKLRREVAS